MRTVIAILLAGLLAVPAAAATRKPGLGTLVAEKLLARRGPRPHTHSTDFAGEGLGCITLVRREMRRFGYPGHAFACEEASAGEVLGAVLNTHGRALCYISGFYVGDGCYDLEICGDPETLCVD